MTTGLEDYKERSFELMDFTGPSRGAQCGGASGAGLPQARWTVAQSSRLPACSRRRALPLACRPAAQEHARAGWGWVRV